MSSCNTLSFTNSNCNSNSQLTNNNSTISLFSFSNNNTNNNTNSSNNNNSNNANSSNNYISGDCTSYWAFLKYYKTPFLARLWMKFRKTPPGCIESNSSASTTINNTSSNTNNNNSKTLRALCMGLNYKGSYSPLNGCENDRNEMVKFLRKLGYRNSNITTIGDDKTIKPTKKNILDQIKKILISSRSNDVVFISYSGHGSFLKDDSNDEYDGNDEYLVAYNESARRFERILDDEIKQILNDNLKPGVKVFFIIDCCNSGTIIDLKYNSLYTDGSNAESFENTKQSNTPSQVIALTACMDKQLAYETKFNNKVEGVFTKCFIEATSSSSTQTWDQLLKNIRDSIVKKQFPQKPQLSSGLPLNLSTIVLFN